MHIIILQLLPIMEFIQFRRNIHRYPETSGKEFETTQKIKGIAMRHGVREDSITMAPQTGLWIDLSGEAEPRGRETRIALRADIDALQMTEGNAQLEYRSVREGAAHMCGHDGHTATLAATIPLFLAKAKEIPRNKHVRLIFQPAEESIWKQGAVAMIKAGCLQGVDQIYGFHNHNTWPIPFGYFSCKEGLIMYSSTEVKITITGTSGHSSEPEKVKFALPRAVAFYQALMSFVSELKSRFGEVLTVMLPLFRSGEHQDVISAQVTLQGSVRTCSSQVTTLIINKIKSELQLIEGEGFETTFQQSTFPITHNHKAQIDHVTRMARELYGEALVGQFGLPCKAGQDFGRYTEVIPGAFFFVCGADQTHKGMPHISNYNFNDRLIPLVSNFWMALLQDRFAE